MPIASLCTHRLPTAPALQTWLQQQLPQWPAVHWHEHSGSTNTALLQSPVALPALLGSHWQQQGRGRAGRAFITPAGTALTFSCAYATPLPAAALPTVSLWLAVAACSALRDFVSQPHRLKLKWPNDLNWDDAKLAGMLLETQGGGNGTTPRKVVVGIGLNLRPGQQLSGPLGRAVAGWADTGAATPAAALIVSLAKHWQAALHIASQHWQPQAGLPLLPGRFAEYDTLSGRNVDLLEQGRTLASGCADGIEADGRLRIRQGSGAIFHASVGDISVRPTP